MRHVARRASRGSEPISTSSPGELAAQRGRLAQRQAALAPAADVDAAPAQCSGSRELLLDQVDEVVDVQQVAHLLARAAVADVGQRRGRSRCASIQWVKTPWSTLPICHGPGDHAAAVDHRAQPEGLGVLGDAAARPRASSRRRACARPSSGKSSAMPVRGGARRRLLGGELEARLAPRRSASASSAATG